MMANGREEQSKDCTKQSATSGLYLHYCTAVKVAPTADVETALNFSSQDILILGEARIGTFKLKLSNKWKTSRSHGGIKEIIANLTFEVGGNNVPPQYFRIFVEKLVKWRKILDVRSVSPLGLHTQSTKPKYVQCIIAYQKSYEGNM